MKRITAIIIAAVAIVGSSYVGAANAADNSPCSHIAEASIATLGATPSHPLYGKMTDMLIAACVDGAAAHNDGMTQEFAEAMVNDSVARTIKLQGEKARAGAEALSMAYLGGYELAKQKDGK